MSSVTCVDQRRLVLKGVEATDLARIQQILCETPFLAKGLAGGGLVLLADGTRVPVLGRKLSELVITPGEWDGRACTVVDLPEDWNRIWNYHTGLQDPRRRASLKSQVFYRLYLQQLHKAVTRMVKDHVLQSQWGPGVQATADVHPGLAPGEVGLPRSLARKVAALVRAYQIPGPPREAGEPELRAKQLDGLECLNLRYPVAGEQGVRWCRIRVLSGVRGRKIYLNPADLQLLLGGDVDGDLVYVAVLHAVQETELDPVRWPKFEIYHERRDDAITLADIPQLLAEIGPRTKKAAIDQVLSGCLKDLTGILTHIFHVMARGAAVRAYHAGEEVQAVYRRVFTLYFPLIERVMDAKKEAGDQGFLQVQALAQALEGMLSGAPLDELSEAAFAPFLSRAEISDLGRLYLESECLANARKTATGQLLAAGRNKDGAMERVLAELLKDNPQRVLRRLRDDLLLLNVAPMPQKKGKRRGGKEPDPAEAVDVRPDGEDEDEEEAPALTTAEPTRPLKSLLEAFTSLTYAGKPVFAYRSHVHQHGYQVVTLSFLPWWKKGETCKARPVTIPLPHVMKVEGFAPSRHRHVQLPGEFPRLFRPVLRLTRAGVELFDARNDLRVQLQRMVDHLVQKDVYLDLEGEIAQAQVMRTLRNWVHQMEETSTEHDVARERDFVNQWEIRIEVDDTRDVRRRWSDLAQILDWAHDHGYDITATGKGTPGDRCSLADERGFARWGRYLNPFFDEGNWARHNQLTSGVKDAVRLRYPEPPSVEREDHPFPDAFWGRVACPRVALFNGSCNQFPDHQGKARAVRFDVLTATPLGVELLAPASEHFDVTWGEKDAFVQRLLDAGVSLTQIHVEERSELLTFQDGGYCSTRSARIHVTDVYWDEGKIAAYVGPLKGTLHVPGSIRRMWTVDAAGGEHPVHLAWESTSAWKKKAPDMLAVMALGEAGVHVIPEDWTLADAAQVAAVHLEARGLSPDGLQEVWVEHADGTVENLGPAFVGPLPVYRCPQTETATFRVLHPEGKGLKVEAHAQFLAMRDGAPVGYQPRRELERRFFHHLRAITLVGEQLDQQGAQASLEGHVPPPVPSRR